jgi:hypothetical protein
MQFWGGRCQDDGGVGAGAGGESGGGDLVFNAIRAPKGTADGRNGNRTKLNSGGTATSVSSTTEEEERLLSTEILDRPSSVLHACITDIRRMCPGKVSIECVMAPGRRREVRSSICHEFLHGQDVCLQDLRSKNVAMCTPKATRRCFMNMNFTNIGAECKRTDFFRGVMHYRKWKNDQRLIVFDAMSGRDPRIRLRSGGKN